MKEYNYDSLGLPSDPRRAPTRGEEPGRDEAGGARAADGEAGVDPGWVDKARLFCRLRWFDDASPSSISQAPSLVHWPTFAECEEEVMGSD